MFNVEQFIYTTASIENKKGYQIVAKSEGITEKIVEELETYAYPVDLDPRKFNESRSLLELENDELYEQMYGIDALKRVKQIENGDKDEKKELIGGIYGIALGSMFFGESMFSKEKLKLLFFQCL